MWQGEQWLEEHNCTETNETKWDDDEDWSQWETEKDDEEDWGNWEDEEDWQSWEDEEDWQSWEDEENWDDWEDEEDWQSWEDEENWDDWEEEEDYEQEPQYDQEECDNSWECQDFYECGDDLKNFDSEYCYVEECWNVCEETYCNIFRTDDTQYNQYDGTYYWTTEECPVDEQAQQIAAAQEHANEIAEGF